MDKKQLLEQVRREVLRRAATTDYYSYVQYVHPRIYRPNRAAQLVCKLPLALENTSAMP